MLSDVVLRHQSSLEAETERLASACSDLVEKSKQREEELGELSELLSRVKQRGMRQRGQDPRASAATGPSPGRSPGGTKLPVPQVMESGLGALTAANRTLSQFQAELDSGLSQLTHQAGAARRSASAMRAQVDLLTQLVSPGKTAPDTGDQVDEPTSEAASLLRALQDAAKQRALVESALRSPSPRGPGLLAAELLAMGINGHGDPAAASSEYQHQQQQHPGCTQTGTAPGAAGFGAMDQQPRVTNDTQPGAFPDQPRRASQRQVLEQQQPSESSDGSSAACGLPGSGSKPPGTGVQKQELVDQAKQFMQLQAAVKLLEAQRDELHGTLSQTGAQISSCSIELEAVRAELDAAKEELGLQQARLQAARSQAAAVEAELHSKREQLQLLEDMVQVSSAQLAELEAHIAAATAASAAAGPTGEGAHGSASEQPPNSGRASARVKRRVKRHVLVRRTRSCSDLAAATGVPAAATPDGQPAGEATATGSALVVPKGATNPDGAEAAGSSSSAPGAGAASGAADPAFTCSGCVTSMERLAAFTRELAALTEDHSKVLVQLEQERHAGMAQHCEVVSLRRQLRAHQAAALTRPAAPSPHHPLGAPADGPGAAVPTWRSPGTGGGVKRPLSASMAGMEELLEEAAADLEQVEGHVGTATQRLLGLQAQSLALAKQVAEALRSRAQAEAAAGSELQRAQALRAEADTLQRTVAGQQQAAARHDAQLAAARQELQQLQDEHEETRRDLERLRTTAQEEERRAQEAQVRRLQEEHGVEAAAEARKSHEHELLQQQARVEELERRAKEAEQSASAAAEELQRLEAATAEARQTSSAAAGEAARAQQQAVESRAELAAAVEVSQQQVKEAHEDAAAAAAKRAEAEEALRESAAALQAVRDELEQAQANAQVAQKELAKLRAQQQELESAAERHEQQAAVAQRRAESAQEELNRLNDQLAASRRQLDETQEQLAALRRGLSGGMGMPPRGSASGAGTAASTPGGIHASGTPGSAMFGMAAFGQGLGPEQVGVYALGPGPMGQYPYHVAAQHQHMATVMQLQAEVERLQVAMVQAQSRQRLAEQRASDAEQLSSELQARLNSVRAQQHNFGLHSAGDDASSTSATAAVHKWRAKADDLQQELDACQHLVGRYKTRMAAAQDEASGLEEGLQRERAETRRLRQQLELLQQEVHGQRLLLQQQQQQQQMAQEQSKLLQADHVRAAAAASAASLLTTPTAGPKVSGHGGASAGVSEAPGHAALAAEVEARTEQLRKLQQQVSRQQELHSELLEEHDRLRRQGTAMRSQLDEAAAQLLHLKAQFEKGKVKLEQLKAQQGEVKARIAALVGQEEAASVRLQQLQQQAAALEARNQRAQGCVEQKQQELAQLTAEVAAARSAVESTMAKDGSATDTSDAVAAAKRAAEAEAARAAKLEKRVTDLELELRAAQQAASEAERSLEQTQEQLREAERELAAAARASKADPSTTRLQQQVEELQSQVAELRAEAVRHPATSVQPPSSVATTDPAAAAAAGSSGLAASPGDELALAVVPSNADAQPEGQLGLPAVWHDTRHQVAGARRDLHALQLRIAVACAEEARLTATCAELQRQQAAAEQEVTAMRAQVVEAERRLSELQARALQGERDAEVAAQLNELRDQLRAAQQQARAAEAARAEAEHQAQLAALRLQHAEEQARLAQEQGQSQVSNLAARLREAQAALAGEQQRLEQLRQEHALALSQHASHESALEASLAAAKAEAQDLTTSLVDATRQAEALREQQRAVMEEKEAAQTGMTEWQQRALGLEKAVAAAEASMEAARAECAQLKGRVAEADAAADGARADARALATKLADAEAATAGADAELLRGKVAGLENGLQLAHQDAEAAAARSAEVQRELISLQRRAEQAEAQAAELQSQLDEKAAALVSERAQVEAAQARLGELQALLAKMEAQRDSLWDQAAAAEVTRDDLEDKAAALREQLWVLSQQLTALQSQAQQQQQDNSTGGASDGQPGGSKPSDSPAAMPSAVVHSVGHLAVRRRLDLEDAGSEASEEPLADDRPSDRAEAGQPGVAEVMAQVAELQGLLERAGEELRRMHAEAEEAQRQRAVDVEEREQLEQELRRHAEELSSACAELQAAEAAQSEAQGQLLLQGSALEQLLAQCEALRGQRDEAVAQLELATAALGAADGRSRQLLNTNAQLQAEVQRLQQLAMGAVALVERMQEQQGLLGGAEGQRGQQLHVVQEAPRDEKFTGGVSSRSAASDGEEANAGVERQQPDHGVGAPGSGTTTVVDGSPAPATEPVRESHDSGEEGYKAPATDPGGAVASQSSDTSRMESLYRELLHAVADRTTLENHAQTIQAQLRTALLDKAALEHQVGSLEAQLHQLHTEQEQQLLLMQAQIAALREQLVSWTRGAVRSGSRKGEPSIPMQRTPGPAGVAAPTADTQLSTPLGTPIPCNGPAGTGQVGPQGAHASLPPSATPSATTAATPSALSPLLRPSPHREALQLELLRLQSDVGELTAGLQRAQREGEAAEERAAALQGQAEEAARELAAVKGRGEEVVASLREALAAKGRAEGMVTDLQKQLQEREQDAARAAEDAVAAATSAEALVARLEKQVREKEQAVEAAAAEVACCKAKAARKVEELEGQLRDKAQQAAAALRDVEAARADTEGALRQLREQLQLKDSEAAAAAGALMTKLNKEQSEREATVSELQALKEQLAKRPPRVEGAVQTDQLQTRHVSCDTGMHTRLAAAAVQTEGAPAPGPVAPPAPCMGCGALREQLAAAAREHEQRVQELQQGEVVRLQAVRDEFGRLETHLQDDLNRAQAAAARASADLRRCRTELDAAELRARQAVQEALRAGQQAAAYQGELLALRQALPGLQQQQQQPNAGATAAGGRSGPGAAAVSRRDVGVGSPRAHEQQVQELLRAQQRCAQLEVEVVTLRGEMEGERARAQAAEQWRAAAVKEVEALRAELDSRGGSERQSAAVTLEAEVQVRVAAQAAADAQLLCSLRCQLQEAREELELATADLREAEGRAGAREEEVAGLRHELAQLQRALEQHRTQRQQEQGQLEDGGTGRREKQQAAAAEGVGGAGGAAGVAERLMGQVLALLDGGAGAGAGGAYSPPHTVLGSGSGSQGGDRATRLQGLLGLLDQLRRLTGGNAGSREEERSLSDDSDADSRVGEGGGLRLPEGLHRQLGGVLGHREALGRAGSQVGGTGAMLPWTGYSTAHRHSRTYQLLFGNGEGGGQLRDQQLRLSGDEVDASQGDAQLHTSRHRPSRAALASAGGRRQQLPGDAAPRRNSMTSRHGTDSSASDSVASSSTSRSASGRTRRSAPIRRSRSTSRTALLAAGPAPSGAVPPAPAQPVHQRADAACQVDASCPGLQPLLPLSRLSAVAAQLAATQQQHGELTAAVAALRVQAAEAEALVAARTARVAELQAREQQLASAVSSFQLEAQSSTHQLQAELDSCRAAADALRSQLDADCAQLQHQRDRLHADVCDARELLAHCLGGLRLTRGSLAAQAAVHDAVAGLAAAERGGGVVGMRAEAIQQVQVVFACLAELCGRTEGLAAALGELLPRLEAAQLNAPAQAASADTAGSAGAASEGSQQTEGRSSSEPGAGAVEGPGAGVGVEEVRLALRRVFLQLHRRAGRFAQVLRAAAAGEQLPGDLHEGFQRLWTSTEQQLGGVLLKLGVGQEEAGADPGAATRDSPDTPDLGQGVTSATSNSQLAGAPQPPGSVQMQVPSYEEEESGKRPATSLGAAHARSKDTGSQKADEHEGGRIPVARQPLGAVENRPMPLRTQQQQQRDRVSLGAAAGSSGSTARGAAVDYPAAGHQRTQRNEGVQRQGAGEPPAPGRSVSTAAEGTAQTSVSGGRPQQQQDRQQLDARLQQVLSLAKRLQDRGAAAAAPASGRSRAGR